jgi:Domain of unknown function (DUF4258)
MTHGVAHGVTRFMTQTFSIELNIELDFGSMWSYLIAYRSLRGTKMADGPNHHKGSILRALALNLKVRLVFTDHALEEMARDNISQLAVRSMLRRCSVGRVEQNRFEETLEAKGSDVDGKQITAIVVVEDDIVRIKVITAWATKR